MRRLIAIMCIAGCAWLGCHAQPAQEPTDTINIKRAVERIMTVYPGSTLKDIYKSCFQDVYGPAHLIADPAVARKGIEDEIAAAKTFGGPMYESTGLEGNFYRVNLGLVANGTITIDTLMDALLQSCQMGHEIPVGRWAARWEEILRVIEQMGLDKTLPQYEADRDLIAANLQRGDFRGDHSERFARESGYHYRIVHRDLFFSHIAPSLPQNTP